MHKWESPPPLPSPPPHAYEPQPLSLLVGTMRMPNERTMHTPNTSQMKHRDNTCTNCMPNECTMYMPAEPSTIHQLLCSGVTCDCTVVRQPDCLPVDVISCINLPQSLPRGHQPVAPIWGSPRPSYGLLLPAGRVVAGTPIWHKPTGC